MLRDHSIYGAMFGILGTQGGTNSVTVSFFPELFPDLDLPFYSLSQRVWWSIFCVNLTGPWLAQTFGQTVFWACLWGCFWKNCSLFNVGSLIQSVEGLNRTKRLTLPRIKENSSWLTVLSWVGHWFSPAFILELKYHFLLGFEPADLGWNHTTGSPEFPARWRLFLRLVCFHNHVSQFPGVSFI